MLTALHRRGQLIAPVLSNVAQLVCTTAVSPLLLCPANTGPVCGDPAFVTLWAQLGACRFARQPNTVFIGGGIY